MRIGISIVLMIFFGSVSLPVTVSGNDAPSQRQLRTFPLHNNPNSADMSPDEQMVVTESTSQTSTDDPAIQRKAEVVQIWNFKEDRLAAEFRLPEVRTTAFPKYNSYEIRGADLVRYSPDGRAVIALIGRAIHVLSAADLKEIRTIPLAVPAGATSDMQMRAMELSPGGVMVALLWTMGLLHGRTDLYDLSSGTLVRSSGTPQGWIASTRSIAWSTYGKRLLIPIPNSFPCESPNTAPDIFEWDIALGKITPKFTSGLLAGSIAVVGGNRLLAVDENCVGVFKNRDPELRVFDLSTGRRVRMIPGRTTGVRYTVSASADGSRFLAYTGTTSVHFEWGDMVPSDRVVDETFSTWNSSDYDGIATSQNIPGLNASSLRMSSRGNYAVSCGKASYIYELPSK